MARFDDGLLKGVGGISWSPLAAYLIILSCFSSHVAANLLLSAGDGGYIKTGFDGHTACTGFLTRLSVARTHVQTHK